MFVDLANKFPGIYGAETSLLCSQELATGFRHVLLNLNGPGPLRYILIKIPLL
jgi:hypothetical protein